MPEVVSQSGPGAVQPGAQPKPVTPTPPVPPPATPAENPELTKLRQQATHAKRLAEAQVNAAKRAAAAKEKSLSEKMSELEKRAARAAELEKRDSQAKINKTEYAKSIWGENWYEELLQEKINGGAPTAAVVAAEISKLEERIEAKFKARLEEDEKTTSANHQQAVASAKRQLNNDASAFWKESGKEYPVLEGLGDAARVAALLAERIEQRYFSSIERDEQGQMVRDGRMMSMKEAAEDIENQIISLSEKAVGHEKYASRLQSKFKSNTVPNAAQQSDAQQTRRTLSNDLTGSTPGRRPPATESERRERAIAAFEAARKAKT